jgi:hypothetical protein
MSMTDPKATDATEAVARALCASVVGCEAVCESCWLRARAALAGVDGRG